MGNKKVWLVTGCSKGLGKALVEELLAQGYPVIGTSRSKESLEKIFGAESEGFLPLAMNVKEETDVKKAVESGLDLRVLAPLGCGMMTGAGAVVNYLKPEKGESILICGLGAVGFGALVAAKMSGCETVIVIDRIPERLRIAEDFGATHSINSSETMDLTARIKHICSDIDYGYDSTGSSELLSAMQKCLKQTAKACGVGGGHLNGFDWQITDEGYSIPQEMIPTMIDWYVNGQFPIEKLLRFYPFEDVNKAMMAIRQGEVIKPVLVM